MTAFALVGARIFTGEAFLDGRALVVRDGRIEALAPVAALPAEVRIERLDGGLLAPGFIDAQANGGGGVLFNAAPTVETLEIMGAAFARFGTTAMLPTFITDTAAKREKAIGAARAAIAAGAPNIVGIHLEGPFIAPAKKGAHALDLIRPMAPADAEALANTGLATVIVTLAPERVAPRLITRLAEAGVIVSLGHSEATFDVAIAAARAGARGVTHLFNAMSPLGHREPGMVGAALDDGDLWPGLVADGVHVHPAALALALRAKRGPAKPHLVTDAMPTAAGGGDSFVLNGRRVERRGDALTLADGTIAGSDLTMDRALRFVVERLGVDLAEALSMASLYPATFLRLDDERGRLAEGYRADVVHLDDSLHVAATFIAGAKAR